MEQEAGEAEAGSRSASCSGGGEGEGGEAVTGGAGAGIAGHVGGRESPLKAGGRGGIAGGGVRRALNDGRGGDANARERDETRRDERNTAERFAEVRWPRRGRVGEADDKGCGWAANAGA